MIFFDLDNTLLDHDGAEQDAIRTFVSRYHDNVIALTDTPEVIWRQITDKHRARWRAGELNFEQQRRARISELFKRPLTSKQADQLFTEYFNIYQQHWRLFPDVEPALKRLKDTAPLAVLSNGFTYQQEAKLEQTGIRHYFRFVMTSEQAGVAKPDLGIFKAACQRGKVSPEQCWYIGNHPLRDAQAGQLAGMKSVWLNRNALQASPNTRVVRSLEGFVDLVQLTANSLI
ncbi:HAD family hydrolase [Photobacterium lipolyticum]|uniref:HAD family hydrolase n=1 Tax=Photobacterium lipolyticum TaxID=266810 RepID=A0A2T3MT74_9GAMM|nr:HAD family hydrolase [Photobacterium lipolyticum]PSW02104.1 HAD family hydrolase [Photobacterium lipolyticum]